MSEIKTKGYSCEKCGKISLNKESFFKCIGCGRYVCNDNINCTYKISVKIDHNIPNGIPFLHTKTEYRICFDCFNNKNYKELFSIILPLSKGKIYRKGTRNEKEWVFIREKE